MVFGQAVVNGLVLSFTYILMALGFTLIFGIMKVVNFAHGEFYMLGAYALFVLFGLMHMNFLLALILGAILIAILGMLIERTMFRRLGQEELKTLILSLAISMFLQNLAIIVWGATNKSIQIPIEGILSIGTVKVGYYNLLVIFTSIVMLILFYLFLKKIRIGQALIAVSLDEEMASVQGVNINQIKRITFGVGIFLAAFAGGLVAPMYSVSPVIGANALLNAFIVVILGGLGSIVGAFWGGLIIGMARSFFTTYIGAAEADLLIFVIIGLILLFKPTGLLGGERA